MLTDPTQSFVLVLGLVLGSAACSSDPEAPPSTSRGGTGGTAGGGAGGSAGTVAAGTGGGGTAGTGGSVGGGGAGGTAGTAGTGGTGGGGSGGTAGSGGTPNMPVTCPPGPFEAPQAGESMEVCQDVDFNHGYNEGPTWVEYQGAFYFSNFVQGAQGNNFTGDIIKYTPGGDCEFAFNDVGTNGLARSIDGNLLGASHLTRSISHYDVTTKEVTIIADMYMNDLLDSPNDLIEHPNGTIYFTNPTYEVGNREPGFGPAVFRIDPLGVLSVIDQPGGQPNGITLSPDNDRLYVVGSGTYNLDADGVPTEAPDGFSPGGDGLGMDCAGNVYQSGGQIRDPNGNNVGNFPGGTNLAFGGADMKTLLVVHGGTGVRVVTMNVPGLP